MNNTVRLSRSLRQQFASLYVVVFVLLALSWFRVSTPALRWPGLILLLVITAGGGAAFYGLLKTRHFAFVVLAWTLQPAGILMLGSSLQMQFHAGWVDGWNALLTSALYVGLWLIPIGFPKASQRFVAETISPKSWLGKMLVGLMVALAGAGASASRLGSALGRQVSHQGDGLGVVLATFFVIGLAFFLQFFFVAQIWAGRASWRPFAD